MCKAIKMLSGSRIVLLYMAFAFLKFRTEIIYLKIKQIYRRIKHNMSSTREAFLVESLKHVSLQRLRNLKMEMDKMARDSRINSDLAFWKLLEIHHIK